MASNHSTIEMDLPTIRIMVRMPRLYGLRLKVVGLLMSIAAWVAGDMVDIEVSGTDEDDA